MASYHLPCVRYGFTYDHVVGGLIVAQYEGTAEIGPDPVDPTDWVLEDIKLDGLDASAPGIRRDEVFLDRDSALAFDLRKFLLTQRADEIEEKWCIEVPEARTAMAA